MPDPAEPFDRTRRMQDLHEVLAERFMRQGMDAAREAVAAYEKALTEPVPPPPSASGPMFILDESHVWRDVPGIVGVDFGFEPPELAVAWPRQYGKTLMLRNVTFEGPFSEGARELAEQIIASIRARQDRMLGRLATELGIHPQAARCHFDTVQHILEAAGIGDGYGNLTLPQPVRPPIVRPVVPQLVPVYTDPFEQLTRLPGTRPPLILCSWKPRPHHTGSQ